MHLLILVNVHFIYIITYLLIHFSNQKFYLLILFNGIKLTWTNNEPLYLYIYMFFFFININKDEQILQQIWMNPTTGPQCKMLPNNNNTNNNNNNNRVFMNIFIKDELLIICHTTGTQKAWKKSE